MHRRVLSLSSMLDSPPRILAVVLMLVFAVESAVMSVLPFVVPDSLGDFGHIFVDASLLTLVCAPLLWLVIIGPLRRIAIQEHQRSETIVANAGEAIITADSQGVVQSCNPAAAQLFEISFENLMGSSLRDLMLGWPGKLTDLTGQHLMQAQRAGQSSFPVQITVSPYPSSNQEAWIVILRDLSSAQQAEEERISMARQTEALRAQQMATLAQLATGVAHEIRNPLTSIKMLIQVNLSNLSAQGFPTEDLKLVEQEIRRMERSINSLLDFARPETPNFTVFSVQEPVNRTIQLIEGRCSAQQVLLNVILPSEDLYINGDSTQIQQLLLNLCLNSLDAMPSGGSLCLRVQKEAKELVLTVSDSGSGIDPVTRDQLFEPFFTTKPNGVGLGLGICRRIAENHGGTLFALDNKSGGAVFELRLPLSID